MARKRTSVDEERTVTVAEAAEITDLSKHAIGARLDRGTLPYSSEDGLRRIPLAELYARGLVKREPKPRTSGGRSDVDGAIQRLEDAIAALLALAAQVRAEIAAERKR